MSIIKWLVSVFCNIGANGGLEKLRHSCGGERKEKMGKGFLPFFQFIKNNTLGFQFVQ